MTMKGLKRVTVVVLIVSMLSGYMNIPTWASNEVSNVVASESVTEVNAVTTEVADVTEGSGANLATVEGANPINGAGEALTGESEPSTTVPAAGGGTVPTSTEVPVPTPTLTPTPTPVPPTNGSESAIDNNDIILTSTITAVGEEIQVELVASINPDKTGITIESIKLPDVDEPVQGSSATYTTSTEGEAEFVVNYVEMVDGNPVSKTFTKSIDIVRPVVATTMMRNSLLTANEEPDVKTTFKGSTALDGGNTICTVAVKSIPNKPGVTITSITTPDGVVHNGDNATYVVTAVGRYNYTITYTIMEEGTLVTKTFIEEHAVHSIEGKGDISISCSTHPESSTTYNLREQTDDVFQVDFQPAFGGTKGTIIEIAGYKYGSEFRNAPSTASIINSAINGYKMYIVFKDAIDTRQDTEFKMETIPLTQELAEKWIDEGTLGDASIYVTEYKNATLSGSGASATVTGDVVQTVKYGTMTPSNYTDTTQSSVWTAKNTYSTLTSSNAYVSERMIGHNYGYGVATGSDYYGFNQSGYNDPSLRYEIGMYHKGTNPLVEIGGIKVYAPHDNLELSGVSKFTSTVSSVVSNSDFDQLWSDWTISSRRVDADGKSYYLINPIKRTFNISTDLSKDKLLGGMRIAWSYIDPNIELPYSTSTVTPLASLDTEVIYKVPNSVDIGQTSIYKHTGPKITIMKRNDNTRFINAYNGVRLKGQQTTEIVVGSTQTNEEYNRLTNSYATFPLSTTILREEKYPVKDAGTVTQEYDFPFEIQPSAIHLSENSQGQRGSASYNARVKKNTKLNSIEYVLEDNSSHYVSASDIDMVNAYYSNQAIYNVPKVTFQGASDTNPVRKVKLIWDSILTEYIQEYPFQDASYNAPSPNGYHVSGMSTVTTGFTFKAGEYHEASKTNPIENGFVTQVKHRVTFGNNKYNYNSNGDPINGDQLTYKFKAPLFPDLASKPASVLYYGPDEYNKLEAPLGTISIYTGRVGEKLDVVENPSISLNMKIGTIQSSTATPSATQNDTWPDNNMIGMKASQTLSYLSGKMTVLPKAQGWKFIYSTNLKEDIVYELNDTIPSSGLEIDLLKMPENGSYITKLKLVKDGQFDTSHSSPTDTSIFIDLVTKIMIRRLSTNPVTGEYINTKVKGDYILLYLDGYITYDNAPTGDVHSKANGRLGQNMYGSYEPYLKLDNIAGTYNERNKRYIYHMARQQMYYHREIDFGENKPAILDITQKTVYQGDIVNFKNEFFLKSLANRPNLSTYLTNEGVFSMSGQGAIPWAISEGVYIELRDNDKFKIDIATTKFFGYPANSSNIISEFVNVGAKRYLRLRFTDNFIRETPPNIFTYATNMAQNMNNNPDITMGGVLEIGVRAMTNVEPGIYYPLGKVYLDYSQLLKKYDQENKDSFMRTEYKFKGAVADPAISVGGLSVLTTSQEVSEPKLFEYDMSGASIKVIRKNIIGASTYPGNSGVYSWTSKLVDYKNHERDKLELLTYIQSGELTSLYDTQVYLPLPRANKPVDYYVNGAPRQVISDRDLMLRSLPEIVFNDKNITGITYAYTMSDVVGDTSASTWYTTLPSGKTLDDVTGIRITVPQLPQATIVAVKIPLRATEKDTIGDFSSYISGFVKYKDAPTATTYEKIELALNTYKYHDYDVTYGSGFAFWDTNKEDGVYAGEGYVSQAKVKLYKPDGVTLIMETATNTRGEFNLKTCTQDEGQIIKIEPPNIAGITVKMTAKSKDDFYANRLDSDFNRTTNSLVLPKIGQAGFQGISVGMVKLPVLRIDDIRLKISEVAREHSGYITRYVTTLPEAPAYRLEYMQAADTSIAKVKTFIDNENKSLPTKIDPMKIGTTTAKIRVINSLGDVVEKEYKIIVENAYQDITYEKVWVNDEGKNTRPSSINVQLMRKDMEGHLIGVGPAVVITDGGLKPWSNVFKGVPQYNVEDGSLIEYSIVESDPDKNYKITYSDMVNNKIVSTSTLQTISLPIKKVWNITDNLGPNGMPPSVEIHLMRGDNPATKVDTVTLTSDNLATGGTATSFEWHYTFTDVIKYDPVTQTEYAYSLYEVPINATYNFASVSEGMSVVNTYPALVKYTVTVEWDHGDLPVNKQAKTVTLDMKIDNVVSKTKELNGTETPTPWNTAFVATASEVAGKTIFIEGRKIPGYEYSFISSIIDPTDSTKTDKVVKYTYSPKPTTITPIAEVKVVGDNPIREVFKLELIPNDVNNPMPDSGGLNTVQTPGDVDFGSIKFPKAGTYEYTIKQYPGNNNDNYTYDTSTYRYVVTVEDVAGDGVLVPTVKIYKNSETVDTVPKAVFNNIYKPKPVTYQVSVEKDITGIEMLPVGTTNNFEFKMIAQGSTPALSAANSTARISGVGSRNFTPITFTDVGIYEYIISEQDGGVAGYAYDKTQYVIKLTVADNAGQLAVTPSMVVRSMDSQGTYVETVEDYSVGIKFDNVYSIPKIDIDATVMWYELGTGYVRPGSVILELYRDGVVISNVTVSGAADVPSWSHTFAGLPKHDDNGKLYEYSIGEKPVGGGYLIDVSGYTVNNTYPNDVEFEIDIDTLNYSSIPADRKLTTMEVDLIREDKPNEVFKASGTVTLDPITGKKKLLLSVKSSEAEGQMFSIRPKYPADIEKYYIYNIVADGANSKKYQINQRYLEPVRLDTSIQNVVSGGGPADSKKYDFELRVLDGNNPLPAGSTGIRKNGSITGSGVTNFGEIEFNKPGTYRYVVATIGDDDKNYKYDSSQYIMNVEVVETSPGVLGTNVTYTLNGNPVDKLVFRQTYKKVEQPQESSEPEAQTSPTPSISPSSSPSPSPSISPSPVPRRTPRPEATTPVVSRDNSESGGDNVISTGNTMSPSPTPSIAPSPSTSPNVKLEDGEVIDGIDSTPGWYEDFSNIIDGLLPEGWRQMGSWALINLIAAVIGLCLMIIAIFQANKKEDGEEDEVLPYIRNIRYKLFVIICAILMAIFFVLTEDISKPMILIDRWTIWSVIGLIVTIVIFYMSRRWKEDKEDEEESMA